jgi:hypothetical protein
MPSSDKQQEVYLTTAQVRARYGGVSDMWIERRLKDPNSKFPQPRFFGDGRRRRHFPLSGLEEHDAYWAKHSAAKRAHRHPPVTPAAQR